MAYEFGLEQMIDLQEHYDCSYYLPIVVSVGVLYAYLRISIRVIGIVSMYHFGIDI